MHNIRLLTRSNWRWLGVLAIAFGLSLVGGLWAANWLDPRDGGGKVVALPTVPVGLGGTSDWCSGIELSSVVLRIDHETEEVQGTSDSDDKRLKLYWPPGFTVRAEGGRTALVDAGGRLFGEDGTTIRNVGVCVVGTAGDTYEVRDLGSVTGAP